LKIQQSSKPSEYSTTRFLGVSGENSRIISFNRTNLHTAALNIQFDTSDSSEQNNGFIPVITPSFQPQGQNRERLIKHRNTHNLIKINRTSLAPTVQPCKAINFSLLNVRSLSNKPALVNDFIVDNKIDILTLTETWLAEVPDGFVINEATPCGYEFRHVPRKRGRGGGVGIIIKTSLKPKLSQVRLFKSFEYMDLSVNAVNKVLQVIVVYRPPPSKNNKSTPNDFFGEFTTLLEHAIPTQGCSELLITGDFNFHLDDKYDLRDRSLFIGRGGLVEIRETLDLFLIAQHLCVYIFRWPIANNKYFFQ